MNNLKYIWIIFLFCIFFTSCEKIEPIKKENINTQNINEQKNKYENNNYESCGITSCGFKDDLNEKKELGKLNLPDLESYKEKLKILLLQYPEKDKLISSKSFKDFVNQLNHDFFGCKGNIYKCEGTNPYGIDETNYLFYIFIPLMVIENNLDNKGWSESDIETVIQSIKRKDFDISELKETKILIYKEKLLDKISKINTEKINKEKLKTDNNYFKKIVLNNKGGLHDYIISEIYKINVDWEENGQLEEIVNFSNNSFFSLLESLGISKKEFINKVIEINNYEKNVDIKESIVNDLNKKISSIKNDFTMIPKDRYFRNDELYIFNDKFLFNNVEINEYLLSIRHKVLLLFSLGEKEKLYELTNRLSQYNFEKKFLLTNIFKYSKYIEINDFTLH